MAFKKNLTGNWTLTDGLLDPFAVDHIMDVGRALAEQGIVKARPVGLELLEEEWLYRRIWRYQCPIEFTGEDERCVMTCDHIAGKCRVELNGQFIAAFETGAVFADLTEALIAGKNVLSVSVEATSVESGLVGICAPVMLWAGNCLLLNAFGANACVDAGDHGIETTANVYVYTGGQYTFRYKIALDAELVCTAEHIETLRPGAHEIRHHINILNAVPFDRANAEMTSYTIKLELTRLTVGCAVAYDQVVFQAREPGRVCRVPDDLPDEALEAGLSLLQQLGIDGLYRSNRPFDPTLGFWPAKQLPDFCLRYIGMLEGEDLEALAGGETYWPPGSMVWRLTDSAFDDMDLEGLFGVNAMGDVLRASRFVRFLQAERIRNDAMNARLAGQKIWIDWPIERKALYASDALIEFGLGVRPAYDALQEAFKPVALHVQLPQNVRPGESVTINVHLLADDVARDTVTVDIGIHQMNGAVLGAIAVPAILNGHCMAGALTATMPDGETVVIVRIKATNASSEVIALSDRVLTVTNEKAIFSPLMKIAPVHLRQAGGMLSNMSQHAALAVGSRGYRALLPGEAMPCGDTYECLNGLL